ncbi:MAG: type IV pilus modification PilV family protein [Halothermotrichaceae bacterium]
MINNEDGLTLIEILISVAILGIAAVMFAGVFTEGFHGLGLSKDRSDHLKIAEREINTAVTIPDYSSTEADITYTDIDLNDITFTDIEDDSIEENIDITELERIQVEVNIDGSRSIELQTLSN